MEYNTGFQGDTMYASGSTYLMARVPESCCAGAGDKDRCMVTPTQYNGAFAQGCFALVQAQIEHHVTVLGGVSIAVIVIMVSIVITICLNSNLSLSGAEPVHLFLHVHLWAGQ